MKYTTPQPFHVLTIDWNLIPIGSFFSREDASKEACRRVKNFRFLGDPEDLRQLHDDLTEIQEGAGGVVRDQAWVAVNVLETYEVLSTDGKYATIKVLQEDLDAFEAIEKEYHKGVYERVEYNKWRELP